MYRIRKFVNLKIMKTIYFSLVYSHIFMLFRFGVLPQILNLKKLLFFKRRLLEWWLTKIIILKYQVSFILLILSSKNWIFLKYMMFLRCKWLFSSLIVWIIILLQIFGVGLYLSIQFIIIKPDLALYSIWIVIMKLLL